MPKPRYVRQRDRFSCGPTAIMNVLKWSGKEFSYQGKIKPLQRLCKCKPKMGTNHPNFDKALRKVTRSIKGLTVRRVHRPKLKQIDKHLQAGGIIVLDYYWRGGKKDSRHFMTIIQISPLGGVFWTVNDFRKGKATALVTRKGFKKSNLRFQRNDPHYVAWFVSLKV